MAREGRQHDRCLLSASKSVQSMAIFCREPTMYGTQLINSSLTSISGFGRSLSTCLMACLLNPPSTNANPWLMVQTAKDALLITPSLAFSGSEPVLHADHRQTRHR